VTDSESGDAPRVCAVGVRTTGVPAIAQLSSLPGVATVAAPGWGAARTPLGVRASVARGRRQGCRSCRGR
jgi:hypothetical protein